MMVWAGSWLICSVESERKMQMSSDTPPICGNSSHISWPDLPNLRNSCCGPKHTSGRPWSCAICWPLVIDSGIVLPCISRSFGLKSKVSRCDGPPAWYRKMMRLALAGWCSGLTTPCEESAAKRRGSSREFRPSRPSPAMPRPRKVRRWISVGRVTWLSERPFAEDEGPGRKASRRVSTLQTRVSAPQRTGSIPGNGFMQIQYGSGYCGHGRQLGRFQIAWDGRFAFVNQRGRLGRGMLKLLERLSVQVRQNAPLHRSRSAIQGALERPVDAVVPGASPLQNILRKNARRFHIDRVVQQHQRLQGSIGIHAVDGALFPRGGIEGRKTRVQKRALPERVDAPSI